MNREYNSRVSSKNSELLLKNLKNTTGDYFFCRTLYSGESRISKWEGPRLSAVSARIKARGTV